MKKSRVQYHRRKNRQKRGRNLIFLLIFLLLLGTIAAIASCKPALNSPADTDPTTSAAAETSTETVTPTPQPTETEATTAEPTPEPTPDLRQEPPSAEAPVVALTFDDGPSLYDTEPLLDILAAEGVPATFFVLGNQIAAGREDILLRTFNEGHEIANHSFSHVIFTQTDEATIRDELEKTNQLIEQVTGVRPTLMRPPTGAYNDLVREISRDMGLAVINWSWQSCPEDWNHYDNPDHISSHVIEHAQNGHIVLLHDINSATVASVPDMIAGLRERGFRFMTVSDLLSYLGEGEPSPGEVYTHLQP